LEDAKLGIDFVRSLLRRTMLKPTRGSIDVYVIEKAHALTEEAQNALLKTLEEPGEGVSIVLVADNTNFLLPTILSRCIPVTVASSQPPEQSHTETAARFRTQSMGERLLAAATSMTTRDAAVQWLSTLITDLEKEVLATHGSDVFSLTWLRNCTRAYEAISKNVQHKLAIDRLVTQVDQPPLGKRE
jgi:hypothetical protein